MTCRLCGFTSTQAICNNRPCQICTEVAEVDEEINQTLRRLLAKRCDLLSEHNRIHETLMNRLPVELKNRIFELLLPSRNEWGVTPRRERNAMLACISVCRGWRDIALSNPFLWSSMHIVLRTPISSHLINDWILRSQTLPVTYHIKVINEKDLKQSREFLADVMSRCSDRLQSLSLNASLSVLCGSQHNNFRYHHLRRLQITSSRSGVQSSHWQPLSLLNPTASPENIKLRNFSVRLLQISWNRLTSATVEFLELEDLILLFQHAPQMTYLEILSLTPGPSMTPIIHHGLKTLILHTAEEILLGSLTLPCLQVLNINDTVLLTHLPALVQRSSCPLTKLILIHFFEDGLSLDEFQPLTGVTDLVVDGMLEGCVVIKRLLLDVYYFPDLRHLTLRLQPFKVLWDAGVIPLLLDRKRADERGLDKFLVVDQVRALEFDLMWNSYFGEELKALNIGLREDGFEFL